MSARLVVVGHDADVRALPGGQLSASGFSVLAETETLDEAVAAVKRERPDLHPLEPGLLGLDEPGGRAAIVVLAARAPSVVYDDPSVLVDRSAGLRLPAVKVAVGRRGEPKLRMEAGMEHNPRDDELIAVVADSFDALDWPYSKPEGVPVLLSELDGPLGRWPFYVQASAEMGAVAMCSVCPLTVSGEWRLDVADYLALINRGLAFGGFELDFGDGEICFKTVLPVDSADVRTPVIRRLVRANGVAVETYLPELRAVASGKLSRSPT